MAASGASASVNDRLIHITKGDRLVVATHNPGKLREFRALLEPLDIQVLGAAELGIPEPEETGATFAANAELKASAASGASGLVALADDSGLEVRAIGNAPGIYSARWAGPQRDFAAAIRRVEAELAGQTDRRARFIAALALCGPENHADQGTPGKSDRQPHTCEIFLGEVRGQLVFPARGDRGFGYDPIFVPDGHDFTFGEMEPEKKHAISHRASAFRQLIARCLGECPIE